MTSPLKNVDQNKKHLETTPRLSDYEDKNGDKRKKLEAIKTKISDVKLKLQRRLAEALGVSLEEFLANKDALEELKDSLNVSSFIKKKNFINFAFKTQAGSLDGSTQKINQDIYMAFPQFAGNSNWHFYGVCDGHGSHGHLVSNFIKQTMPS